MPTSSDYNFTGQTLYPTASTSSPEIAITNLSESTSIKSFKCNSCCYRWNEWLGGWFGIRTFRKLWTGICEESLPDQVPFEPNNGIPVYGTFNLTSTSEYSLESLCLPETATVYFKNPWRPNDGQGLLPNGFDSNNPSYFCSDIYTPEPSTGFPFEIKAWSSRYSWPYTENGSSIFRLYEGGKARMAFSVCVCEIDRGWYQNDRLYFETGEWFTNQYGYLQMINQIRDPDEYTCTPFAITYSGIIWARSLTKGVDKVGTFTVTFTF